MENLKANKAPGPDLAITELFRWLNEEHTTYFTKLLNECWNLEEDQFFSRKQRSRSRFILVICKYCALASQLILKFYCAFIYKALNTVTSQHSANTHFIINNIKLYLRRRKSVALFLWNSPCQKIQTAKIHICTLF